MMWLPSTKARGSSTVSWQQREVYTYPYIICKSEVFAWDTNRWEAIDKMLTSEGSEGTSHQKTGGFKHTTICKWEWQYAWFPAWVRLYEGVQQRMNMKPVNILTYEKLQKFILHKISQRETEVTKNMNLNVWAIPEIVYIIKKSKAFQHAKEKFQFLLKFVVKNRRSKLSLRRKKNNKENMYQN